jgi:hypothetical protein
VLLPRYAAARSRHARFRANAYEVARDEAIEHRGCDHALQIADIDGVALTTWAKSWTGTHPSGADGWNWPALVEQVPRRAAVLPIALWNGADLCGLALGHASRARLNGSRHTVTLTHVERRPEPPAVALRGHVIPLAVIVAENYGLAIGARRLRLRAPAQSLLGYYERAGFETTWKGGMPLYCEREIVP